MYEKINTKDGSVLEEKSIEEFKSVLRGKLIRRGDEDYNSSLKVWNGMIGKHPSLIAKCSGTADVINSVKFALKHNIIVSVLGGGHSIAGNGLCDGGLVIDLSNMKSIVVDPISKTAIVQHGASLGDVDHETAAFGLVLPIGINSTTGIAGLTLGGGFGWLSRKYGLTIDNLISANVVTANGEMVRASNTENTDLFWAIRGGGGNFGIVTSFQFQLHQVGPMILAGLIIHPLAEAHKVLKFYRDFNKTTPEEMVCWFVLRKAPPLPFLAPEWHGKEILALAVCHTGNIEEGQRIAKPIRSFGAPIADVISPMPLTAWQQILDPLLTPGARNYWKSNDFLELSDGLIDVLIDFTHKIPDPMTEIAFGQLGGAIRRIPKDATAFGHRDNEYFFNIHGRWEDPMKDEACINWVRSLYNATTPFATGGVYVNFLTEEEKDRVRAAYGTNYERLVELKTKYDPDNFFSVNQNIKPKVKDHMTIAG